MVAWAAMVGAGREWEWVVVATTGRWAAWAAEAWGLEEVAEVEEEEVVGRPQGRRRALPPASVGPGAGDACCELLRLC